MSLTIKENHAIAQVVSCKRNDLITLTFSLLVVGFALISVFMINKDVINNFF